MKRMHLTATRLRTMLSILLFVIIGISGVLFSFAYHQLSTMAVSVSHTVADSTASENNLSTLQKVQQELKQDATVISRASSIVADSQSYQYQDQIFTDLSNYAAQSGLAITNVNFGTAATGAAAAVAPTASTITGVQSSSVSVTLQNPVNYTALLTFIRSIENNLTKMQISSISISQATGGMVTSDALTIQVYIK